ncbi:MAG: NAD(P)/FAD-dependent oxidoreductase [Bacillota bacterium]
METYMYDVIVIGGGPAGLMAAYAAGRAGARVLLLEKGERLGRKLIISGGGRCNVTNRKEFDELIKQIPGNGRFLYSALHSFGSEEIIHLFEGLGVRLKEEDHGRMFPVTDRAVTVAEALIREIRELGVQIRLGAAVDHLTFAEGRCTGVKLRSGDVIPAGAVVVAVGGASVPTTGSTGDGYAWAKQAGHTITPLYPTEVPLTCSDPFIRERLLQGLSLREVALTLYDPKAKRLTTQTGDMIFTHFGLSGPAALRVGHYVSVARMKHGPVDLRLTIDLLPGQSEEQVYQASLAAAQAEPKRAIKNVLRLVPDRMLPLLLELAEIDPTTTYAHLPRDHWRQLARLIKAFPVTVTGTLKLEEAFITGGGVSVKEVDPASMASKLVEGLYFAGEVLDVHGHTGGYNITIAFSTGHAAGHHAARAARERLDCIEGASST